MKKKEDRREQKPQLSDCRKQKKQRSVISKPKPFLRLSPLEMDRVILECFTNQVNVVAVLDGSRLLSIDDLFGFNAIPDTVHRIEKYFNQTG